MIEFRHLLQVLQLLQLSHIKAILGALEVGDDKLARIKCLYAHSGNLHNHAVQEAYISIEQVFLNGKNQ